MEIKTIIKLTKDEVISIIAKHCNLSEDSIEFVFKEQTVKNGYSDEGYQYKTITVFDGVVSKTSLIL